jgi:hypothetical protein
MASASITTRTTGKGAKRYVVRFRLDGASYPVQHGGSFRTLKDAKTRLGLVAGELAAGRNPADVLRAPVKVKRRTLGEWADAYQASRVDYAADTVTNMASP